MKNPAMTRAVRGVFSSLCAVGLTWGGLSAAQAAPVDIEVWHALPNANKAEFEKLVRQFNKEQDGVAVKLRAFASQDALTREAQAGVKAKGGPTLIQLEDNRSPEVIADDKSIMPLHQLVAKYPFKDTGWYLPATASFVRDARNRLLAFPFMAEVPVMFYNTDAYKKAGLNAAAPARTWSDLQGELLKLRDTYDCPYASSDQVSIHLENLAAVNNQPYTSNDNGFGSSKAKGSTLQFNTLFMRHVSLMVSWKRSMLFTTHTDGDQADPLFAKGTCAVLMSGSGAFGEFAKVRGLNFGVAPLPYYDQVTKQAGRPFVSGSAFWVVQGRPAAEEKATASFLAWLSTPVVATQWHQNTGYLPLTDAAFRASDVSFYNKYPGAHALIDSMRAQPGPNERGFRMANYNRILPILNAQLDDAFEGKTPPMAALNSAATEARALSAK